MPRGIECVGNIFFGVSQSKKTVALNAQSTIDTRRVVTTDEVHCGR
jgi:hypothetical protein